MENSQPKNAKEDNSSSKKSKHVSGSHGADSACSIVIDKMLQDLHKLHKKKNVPLNKNEDGRQMAESKTDKKVENVIGTTAQTNLTKIKMPDAGPTPASTCQRTQILMPPPTSTEETRNRKPPINQPWSPPDSEGKLRVTDTFSTNSSIVPSP